MILEKILKRLEGVANCDVSDNTPVMKNSFYRRLSTEEKEDYLNYSVASIALSLNRIADKLESKK